MHDLFYEHDAQAILNINIPQTNQQDRIAWHFEKNGLFTSKSAYMLALNLKHPNNDSQGCNSSLEGEHQIWNCIWKTKVFMCLLGGLPLTPPNEEE
jgi:hypothetical protein